MNALRPLRSDLQLLLLLSVLGLAAQLANVQIPHTQLFIEGRLLFGFLGFALLARWWLALALTAILSLPWLSDVPLWFGLTANLMYALPSLAVVRVVHARWLTRLSADWIYGAGWLALVLACYEVFVTPVVAAAEALRTSTAVWPAVRASWTQQPFLVEAVLVGLVSASGLVAIRAHLRLRRQRRRLDHLNRILQAIRNVNQLITHEPDPQRLIERACEHLTETLGYHNAWIAVLDPGSNAVVATADQGFNGRFAPLRAQLRAGEFPACMRSALETEEVIVGEAPWSVCADCPLTSTHGEWADLTRQLTFEGTPLGVLAVSVPARYARDAEEQSLLHEVAGDLAFALHKAQSADALRDSRRRYQEIFDSSRDGYVMVSEQGRILDANLAYCAITGYTLTELRGMADFYQLTPQRYHDWQRDIWDRQLFPQGHSGLYEKEYIRKDGTLIPIEAQAYVARRADGSIEYIWATVRDISERKQAERDLQQSEARFRSFVENAHDIVYALTPDGDFTYISPNWQEFMGEPATAAIGKSFAPYVHPDDVQLCYEFLDAVLRSGEKQSSVEYRVRRKDGVWRWHVSSGSPLRDYEGNIVSYVGIARDVTERKAAEEALRSSEERFRLLLNDIAMVSVQGYAPDGTTLYWNKGSHRLYGYTAEEALGRNLLDLIIPPEMRDTVAAAMRDMAETGVPIPAAELSLLRKDGERVTVFSSHSIVQRPSYPQELFCIDIDLSAIKQAESEREKLHEQLVQAQKMESVGRLAGGVAHDFNNMLSVILGHAELSLLNLPEGHKLREHLSEIQVAAQRSADLTRQLLAFARRQTVTPRVLDLNETIESMLKMLRRLIGENIDLVWQPGEDVEAVRIDPVQIDQMLANLVVNARDAIDGVGRITIETGLTEFDAEYCADHAEYVPGRYVLLTVSDDGRGMDEATRTQVFEPFFTTKPAGEGTGLGLSTVYGIIKQNGGFINVYSEPGAGTIFRIYLPVHTTPTAVQERPPKELAPSAPNHETVLLVEDEPAILTLGTRMLERAGYRVLPAATPGEALRLAREHAGEIHLLITDVVMPEMNGRNLARQLLALYPDVKRLFMSGYTADVIAHQGVLDDGVQFIQKPFSMQALCQKAREALDE